MPLFFWSDHFWIEGRNPSKKYFALWEIWRHQNFPLKLSVIYYPRFNRRIENRTIKTKGCVLSKREFPVDPDETISHVFAMHPLIDTCVCMQLACLKSNDCISPLNKFQSKFHLEAGNKQLQIWGIETIFDRQIASYCSQFVCPLYLFYETI